MITWSVAVCRLRDTGGVDREWTVGDDVKADRLEWCENLLVGCKRLGRGMVCVATGMAR